LEKSTEIHFSCGMPKISPMLRDVTSGILDFCNVGVYAPGISEDRKTYDCQTNSSMKLRSPNPHIAFGKISYRVSYPRP